MNYIFAGICEQNKRESNMDRLLLVNRVIDGENVFLGMVCDGVGSLKDGSFASGAAVEVVGRWFDTVEDCCNLSLKLRDCIVKANELIVAQTQIMKITSASTLTALLIVGDVYYIIHIGDSRIYAMENGEVQLLTDDDVAPDGKLSGYIGINEKILPHYEEGNSLDKTFVLCSDGLYKKVDVATKIEFLKFNTQQQAKSSIVKLAEYAINSGEQDNISVGVVKAER